MVYTISQMHSRDTEKTMRQNNPDYEKFKLDKEKENREFLRKKLKEVTLARSKILLNCKNCGATVKYVSMYNHQNPNDAQRI